MQQFRRYLFAKQFLEFLQLLLPGFLHKLKKNSTLISLHPSVIVLRGDKHQFPALRYIMKPLISCHSFFIVILKLDFLLVYQEATSSAKLQSTDGRRGYLTHCSWVENEASGLSLFGGQSYVSQPIQWVEPCANPQ